MKQVSIVATILLGLTLAGCDGGTSSDGFGDRSGNGNKGMLSLSITDAAVDNIAEVWIEFSSVEIKPADGSSITYTFEKTIDVVASDGTTTTSSVPEPVSINLLDLQGSLSADFFNNLTVPSGDYNWIRLAVNAVIDGTQDSYIVMKDGTVHELGIPSGSKTGLKINTSFSVEALSEVAMTIDFDLRKSIVMSNSEYHLKPTLRLVDNANAGSISGSINSGLTVGIAEGCSDDLPETGNAVYVFNGADALLDDIDDNDPEPVTTALLSLNTNTGNYDYEVGFLPAGNYTVAYTCMADLDDPETDDVIVFRQTSNVTVATPEQTGGAEFNR